MSVLFYPYKLDMIQFDLRMLFFNRVVQPPTSQLNHPDCNPFLSCMK